MHISLEQARELGRAEGREIVRKINQDCLLKHYRDFVAWDEGYQPDDYEQGYQRGLEFALHILNIK
jgi:hypothetical protein